MVTILKRLVTVIPTLIGVVIVTFLLTRVLPGDPAVYFAGPAATPQSIAEIRKSLGLDRPLPDQFARYVNDLAHGNFGNSLVDRPPRRNGNLQPPAGVGGTHAVRIVSGDRDRGAARHLRCGQAGSVDRSSLPRGSPPLAFRFRCFSPGFCWSTFSTSISAGRRRRSAGLTPSPRRRPTSPASI